MQSLTHNTLTVGDSVYQFLQIWLQVKIANNHQSNHTRSSLQIAKFSIEFLHAVYVYSVPFWLQLTAMEITG